MTTMPNTHGRRPSPAAEGLPATGYVSYVDGARTPVSSLDDLARATAAAIAAEAEDRYLRATTDAGERTLTRDEQRTLLVAIARLTDTGETGD